jgi:hypothetical protein
MYNNIYNEIIKYTKIYSLYQFKIDFDIPNYLYYDHDMNIWTSLLQNPRSIYLLEKYPNMINIYILYNKSIIPQIIEKHFDRLIKKFEKEEEDRPENFRIIDDIKINLSKNPEIIKYIFNNRKDLINFPALSENTNPRIIKIFEETPKLIIWKYLSRNPAAIHLLEANPDKIDWKKLSQNPAAIHLLEANPDKINWKKLSQNPAAIPLLEKNHDKINWEYLSKVPNAFYMLEHNIDKIDWYELSLNSAAIHLLTNNKNKIRETINENIAAIPFIRQNQHRYISWDMLFQNQSIFSTIYLFSELDQSPPIFTDKPDSPKSKSKSKSKSKRKTYNDDEPDSLKLPYKAPYKEGYNDGDM